MNAQSPSKDMRDARRLTGPHTAAIAATGFVAAADPMDGSLPRKRSLFRASCSLIDGGVKRIMDIGIASALLVLCAPLMLLLALLVMIDGGPVLFRHRRLGRGLRPFYCLKFRTMMLGAEGCLKEYLDLHPRARDEWELERKLGFDPRVTTIGRLLRKSSLDELPQLFNVLAGDMSLVGPRPITVEEVLRYGADAGLYASVRPGLTGPWQISGRNDVGYVERVGLDARYARERNVIGDFLIITATPRAVLSRRGAK